MLINGTVWTDTQGKPIHAHGGCILYSEGWYYWYGEDRSENHYVNCYRSKDLMNWEFRNHVLTTFSRTEKSRNDVDLMLIREAHTDYGAVHKLCIDAEDVYRKVNIERPKVLYNATTKQYVMWAHFENGVNYSWARAAVATCDTPDGDFVYRGSFRPLGYMSRDCTIFQDEDGTAYFISSSNDNADMHIYRMNDDYLDVKNLVNRLFVGEFREAPVVFKRNGRYYIINSACSGWIPNQCQYSTAEAMDGEWEPLRFCADDTTYRTQPAFAVTLTNKRGELVLYMGDRWSGSEYFSSSYVMLPLEFKGEKELDFNYYESFSIDVEQGCYISENG